MPFEFDSIMSMTHSIFSSPCYGESLNLFYRIERSRLLVSLGEEKTCNFQIALNGGGLHRAAILGRWLAHAGSGHNCRWRLAGGGNGDMV